MTPENITSEVCNAMIYNRECDFGAIVICTDAIHNASTHELLVILG